MGLRCLIALHTWSGSPESCICADCGKKKPHRWEDSVCVDCGTSCPHPSFSIFLPIQGGKIVEKIVTCELCKKRMRAEGFDGNDGRDLWMPLADEGKRVQAMKVYREHTGSDIIQAKEAIDRYLEGK